MFFFVFYRKPAFLIYSSDSIRTGVTYIVAVVGDVLLWLSVVFVISKA